MFSIKTLKLNNSPKQLRNALIIAGSAVVAFSAIIVTLGLVGNNLYKQSASNADVVYDNVISFINESGKVDGDTMQSVLSFTFSDKTKRLMISAVGSSKIFVYDITINKSLNTNQLMNWFLNKEYSNNNSYVENSFGTYNPISNKISYPTCDEITYAVYETGSIMDTYSVSGTYRIDNSFYSFTNYTLDETFIVARENIKYKVTKTSALAFNFFKLIMQ